MSPTHSAIAPRVHQGILPSRRAAYAALHCPFSQQTNPHERTAGVAARAWLLDRFGTSETTQKLVAAGMEQFTAGFYPTANLPRLTWVTKFLFWCFLLDDLVDETDIGRGATSSSALIERFDVVMKGQRGSTGTPLERTLGELLDDLLPFLRPGEYELFCDAHRAYLGALVWEANNRASNWVPDLRSYELFRPAAGAVPPFWMLIGPLEGLRLTPAEVEDPRLIETQAMAGRVACWYNDVLSFEKEYAAKDVHNLAIVLERHRYLPMEAAFEAAIRFCNDDVQHFCDAAEALVLDDSSETLVLYLSTLESMMATTLLWTLKSARYESDAPVARTAPRAG